MSTPFLGQLRAISFNFAPKGWALCNGQLLPINANQALFSLLGTRYGGNGQTNFALPDLRGRTPIGQGNGLYAGDRGGYEFHTVTLSELPQHIHLLQASQGAATAGRVAGGYLADTSGSPGLNIYKRANVAGAQLRADAVLNVGGSQPHENRQPFLVLNWIIALQGIFPSRS